MPPDLASARRHAGHAAPALIVPPRANRSPGRRVWTYAPAVAPGWADFRAGGLPRQRFLRHWTLGQLENLADLALSYGMKLLPADDCSALGAKIGRFAMPRWHKGAVRKTRVNLASLLPDLSEAEREALMRRNWENQGRLMTEFSVVNRMARDPARVRVHGGEQIATAAREGPLILMGVHTGNWELIWSVVHRLGVDAALNYAPPKSPARHWIARRVRRQAGIGLLPPGKHAVRPALDRLSASGTVIIFCDEGLYGTIRGPFLGRTPHADGNLALVARLARKTGASICPIHVLRHDGARFDVHAGPVVRLTEDRDLTEDVIHLNGLIEPVIRDHLDQWYFLDNAL